MSLFFDHLWIWIALTFIVGVCGLVWSLINPKGYRCVIALLLPIFTLVLGLTLYYGVDTDKKSLKRTLDVLIAAVERDDLQTVNLFLSPGAEEVQQLAQTGMNLVRVSEAKYRDLEIEVNNAITPSCATVRFTATFRWTSKLPIEGFSFDQPMPDNAHIEILLVKTKSSSQSASWVITKILRLDTRYFQSTSAFTL